MPYISEYTLVEDGDCYRVRLTDGDRSYDSVIYYDLQEALNELEILNSRDGS